MSTLPFDDIIFHAHQESFRMRHHYLGVEHLLIALLEIKGSIAARLLEKQGFTPEYVISKIRLKIGKGSHQRQWAGIPKTPRATAVLERALRRSHERQFDTITERDLLMELLEERTAIPIRVLQELDIDLDAMATGSVSARNTGRLNPYVNVEYAVTFPLEEKPSAEQLYVLRRMFYGYERLRIDRRLSGGYTSALLLVVTPFHTDGRQDASVAIKIDNTESILDESTRYEQYVKNSLPPLTARIEDRPTTPDNSPYAGVKYTLISEPNESPRDLRNILSTWSIEQLGNWLNDMLFPSFGRLWWQQGGPFRFNTWAEYDWMLPPLLTLEFMPAQQAPPDAHILHFPFRRSRLHEIEYDDVVVVESFTVRKLKPDINTLQLALGLSTTTEMAYKIEVRGIDLEENIFYRGEVVDRLVGRVYHTRREELFNAARELYPDFDIHEELVPYSTDKQKKFMNPLTGYEALLDRVINGRQSKIHGDMHLGNIMVGPNNSGFLIDFARTREGHTAFDWACLEVSILSDVVMGSLDGTWDDARRVLKFLMHLNAGNKAKIAQDARLATTLSPIINVRRIVRQCLADEDNWAEYFVALAFCALRAMGWRTMPAGGRRLMYLVAGMAIHELRENSAYVTQAGETQSPEDETDVNTAI